MQFVEAIEIRESIKEGTEKLEMQQITEAQKGK